MPELHQYTHVLHVLAPPSFWYCPLPQLSQVSALPALALNVPEEHGPHTRFVVCVGARVSRLPASHVRIGLQTRFDVVVSFVDW
jgi:hypothetical protein